MPKYHRGGPCANAWHAGCKGIAQFKLGRDWWCQDCFILGLGQEVTWDEQWPWFIANFPEIAQAALNAMGPEGIAYAVRQRKDVRERGTYWEAVMGMGVAEPKRYADEQPQSEADLRIFDWHALRKLIARVLRGKPKWEALDGQRLK